MTVVARNFSGPVAVKGVPRKVSLPIAAVESFSYMFWPYLLPWVFSLLSLPLALPLLLLILAWSWHTGWMVGRLCTDERLNENEPIGSYRSMTEAVLGHGAAEYVKYVQMIQLFSYILGHTIFQAPLFDLLLGPSNPLSPWEWRLISGASFLAVSLAMPSFDSMGVFAVVAVGVQIVGLTVAIVGTGLTQQAEWDEVDASLRGETGAVPAFQSWVTMGQGLVNMLISFGGHMVYPELMREMKSPSLFNVMLTGVMTAGFICNAAVAVPLYLLLLRQFWPPHGASLFQALPRDTWFSRAAAACVILTQMLSTNLTAAALCLNIEVRLGVPSEWKAAAKTRVPLFAFVSSGPFGLCLRKRGGGGEGGVEESGCKKGKAPTSREPIGSAPSISADTPVSPRPVTVPPCAGAVGRGGGKGGVTREGRLTASAPETGERHCEGSRGLPAVERQAADGEADREPLSSYPRPEGIVEEYVDIGTRLEESFGGREHESTGGVQGDDLERGVTASLSRGNCDRLSSGRDGTNEGTHGESSYVCPQGASSSSSVEDLAEGGMSGQAVSGEGEDRDGRVGISFPSSGRGNKGVLVNGAVVRVCVRVFFISSAVFLAEMLPFFGDIATVFSAFGIVQLTFVIPVVLFLRMCWNQMSRVHRFVCLTEILVGGILFAGGLAAGFAGLTQSVNTWSLFADQY
uniref:Amino acid transporter transmembrane domain-containing protein n=1 Tax=Chromera velia CCMP2878 TaxID=1169474 RepID=A0A0G4GMT5_9ALVE|eukprot:Cvel_22598.t1-p1 / transcript=Cvel_22598.t1 / gene=Cvel_22598 / organism=Chromera_velia_CCMP2878 / gene_product=hypothetical protein / transcript_product=hypothetical protein / location=Cvel_scaffold2236:25028-27640(-) / protein_length=686 / sequence_SO=supercontig / SO=protein_coding / is_pseudo=false